MNARAILRSPALVAALVLGILADLLIRVQGRPGLNGLLWALIGVGVLIMLLRRRGEPASTETKLLVGCALVMSAALPLRDADTLAVFALLSAIVSLMLAAGRATAAWAARAYLSDIIAGLARVGFFCAAGPISWGRGIPAIPGQRSAMAGRARTAMRGTIMALPALVALTALLMSADPVFANLIQRVFRIDIDEIGAHVVFTVVIAWIGAGYLRAFTIRDDTAEEELLGALRVPRPALPAAEISVALWILNLLFISFMIVQLRYLFGGASLVAVTEGLTYADYARRGFFELVATAALVIPIILLADWAAATDKARARSVLRGTTLVLVVLLVGVIGSAAYRMRLYQQAYGLTEQRVYVSMVIVWLTAVLGWLVFTVLRGRRDKFAFGSIIAGFACVAALQALNPHALIASVNIDRAVSGAPYDSTYLARLSADAVPVIVSRLHRLPPAEECRVTHMLRERWGVARDGDWRTWNLSDWRARRMVAPMTTPASCPAPAATSHT